MCVSLSQSETVSGGRRGDETDRERASGGGQYSLAATAVLTRAPCRPSSFGPCRVRCCSSCSAWRCSRRSRSCSTPFGESMRLKQNPSHMMQLGQRPSAHLDAI